jgi:GT2 family glycosyltransferase
MPDCSIIITTRNRSDELIKVLQSCGGQTVDHEVIVVDDGSTDGTSQLVEREFPEVRLIHHDVCKGLVASRNEATEAARSPFVFSIDDDAVFTSDDTLSRCLEYFKDTRVGAVAMPYVNVNISDHIYHDVPDDGVTRAAYTFTGTAHAHRRDLFLKLGGYRSFLFHWGEERDYCLRLMNAGYRVAVGYASPIHHMTSPKRDRKAQNVYLYRNQILFATLNAPQRHLPFLWGWALLWNSFDGLRNNSPGVLAKGLWRGMVDSWKYRRERKRIDPRIFRLAMNLRKEGPRPMEETFRL